MTRRTPLWRTDDVSVHRFDHAHDEHDHGPVDEIGDAFIASFVERGQFQLEMDGRAWRLGPGDVMLLHPGMRFRVGHIDHDLSDVCLSVNYLAAEIAGFDRGRSWACARQPVIRAHPRLRYLHAGIRRALDGDTPLLAETCAAALFQEIPRAGDEHARRYRPHTLDHYADRIHAAREAIDRHFDQPLQLGTLARSVGMSTFHFARLFAELVGTAPHRYLLEARLRAAAAMLRDGRGVTDTAYACGFNSPAHFSRSFTRRFERTPSAYAARPR